jgi:multicomponent Na+:H+ antiporter subunit A
MMIFITLLVVIMLIGAICSCIIKDLLSAVIIAGVVSLIASILFYFLQAPDVAMAEAAIGAALTTAIFVFAIKKTKGKKNEKDD